MALHNLHEALVGVRSGHGVISGLGLSLDSGDTELAVAAGTMKTRFNDPSEEQRFNEGGDLVSVSAPANIKASAQDPGVHYIYAHKDGSVKVDDPDDQDTLSPGPLMDPSKVALKTHPGSVCLGSVECYLASATVTIAGTPAAADTVTVRIKGDNHVTLVTYTVSTGDDASAIATALKTLLEADWRAAKVFTFTVAAGVLTATPKAGVRFPSIEAIAIGGTTAAVANTNKFRNIDYSRRETLV